MFMLIETKVTIEDVTVNTYGIKRNNLRIEDISTNKAEICKIISLLNKAGDVADCHLMDIIEDFIG